MTLGFAPISATPLSALPGATGVLVLRVDTAIYNVNMQTFNIGVHNYKLLAWKSIVAPNLADKSKLDLRGIGWPSNFDTNITG